MDKKNKITEMILVVLSFVLCSCNNYQKTYESHMDEFFDIDRIEILVQEKSWSIISDNIEAYSKLLDEDEIRNCDLKIEINQTSNQIGKIMTLLYSAKKISNTNDRPNVKFYKGEPLYYRYGGMVIDVYWTDGKIDSYIMKNGKNIFYKKGEETVFYKMPKQLIDKYCVTEKDIKIDDDFHP